MSAIATPPTLPTSSIPTRTQVRPQPRRFTCKEFHELGDRGWFEGRGAMLIDGVILEQGPMNPPHATAISMAMKALDAVFTTGFHTRVQLPIVLTGLTDPHPDLAVVSGSYADYAKQHPTTAVLVVEVSDTMLAYDQHEKASLYAAAGIQDYWVINLVQHQLEVRRRPVADPMQPHGYRYTDTQILSLGASIAPLAAPQAQVAVADLLP